MVLKQRFKKFLSYSTWLEFAIVTLVDCALNYQKQVQSKGEDVNKVQAD